MKIAPLKTTKIIDWYLYGSVLFLIILSLLVIYSITFTSKGPDLAVSQLIFAFIGIGVMLLFTFTDYRAIIPFAIPLYFIGLILIFLVKYFGTNVFGSTRWFNLGIFYFQPSEAFKLAIIIILAKFLSEQEDDWRLRDYLFYLGLLLVPVLLVMNQPDFGTALVLLAIGFVLLIVSNIKKIFLYITGLFTLALAPFFWFIILADYQKERIINFFDPGHDPYGTGYNVLQSIITVGSGGLFGKGLGHGSQSQLNFLPTSHTDFIFASLSEQLGFLGALLLLAVFIIMILRIIRIIKISRDQFGYYIACGILVMLLFQILINIGMNVGIMPVTGIPLPFISYGGTNLVTYMAAIGILQSINIRHRKITFN